MISEESENSGTCMWVLIIAFPINVARKNSQNGIPNCPHIMPARSNRGFGIWKKLELIDSLHDRKQ